MVRLFSTFYLLLAPQQASILQNVFSWFEIYFINLFAFRISTSDNSLKINFKLYYQSVFIYFLIFYLKQNVFFKLSIN